MTVKVDFKSYRQDIQDGGCRNEGIQPQVARARLSLLLGSIPVRNGSKKIEVSGRLPIQRAKEKYPILCRTAEIQAKDSQFTIWFSYNLKGQYREKRSLEKSTFNAEFFSLILIYSVLPKKIWL